MKRIVKGVNKVDQSKKTYYVTISSGEISQLSTASPWDYKIEATDEDVVHLREYFEQSYSSDWQGFFRAHVPYLEYHHDPTNDAVDDTMQKVFKMIYELGDEEAREHIKSQNIITKIGELE
ncbi:hydrolase [Cytobacillus sp. S13-E01]|uniref:hydrolase n=1 Tax=Cytobacillus sp. S13-E01 TaxID=3031326 RepID=UPI0023D83614|nr:hydrolase [Cytobacillus sp. S13-E01]MDF0728372.1 hydrolase [Cytobacillus sp. S13-E01]